MRSSIIYYRVADFLKQYPPFSFVSEDELLHLAGRGRVKFHEADEFVYWQGTRPGRFVFVIQKGAVKLIDENRGAKSLLDVLGEGDILGVERLAGRGEYEYSAKTTSDVIIYALLTDDFIALAEKHPKFARYMESQFSVGPADLSSRSTPSHNEEMLPLDFLARRTLAGEQDTPLDDAVARMSRRGRDTFVVTRNSAPVGYLNVHALLANGALHNGSNVAAAMTTPLPVVSATRPMHDYAVEMLRGGCSALGIVDSRGSLQAAVAASELQLLGAPNLPQLGREIQRAQSVAELKQLRRLALDFARDELTKPAGLDWVSEAFSELNRLLVSRTIELDERAHKPVPAACWVFFGSAAHGELLTGAMPDLGLIHADGGDDCARRAGERVSEALRQIGYFSPEDAVGTAGEQARRSLSAWLQNFERWVSDPIISGISTAHRFFKIAHNTQSVTVHGITREESQGGLDEPAAIEQFLDYLGDGAFAGQPEIRSFTLDALCTLSEVKPNDRHTAPGDAFITAQIFLRLLALGRKFSRDTLAALCEPYSVEVEE